MPLPTATPTQAPDTLYVSLQALLPDGAPHVTANVRAGDLLGDGSPQIFVTEPMRGQGLWLRGLNDTVVLKEGLLQPVRTHVADMDGDMDNDLLVADIGIFFQVDDKVGRVILLRNNGTDELEPLVLLEGVGHVVCAEAADLDGDGDMDMAVCVFGNTTGKLLWLEQTGVLVFEEHLLDPRPGAIHAFPFDADGDGDLDLAVSLSQLSEEILLFRNGGSGDFTKKVLFDAEEQHYGMSGIELADLDQDGDTDILFTNGDAFDPDHPADTDPYQLYGLAWLENDGSGRFTLHEVTRHWGAVAVRTIDMDGDGDRDLLLSGLQVPEMFPDSIPLGVVWLENDGAQNFVSHPVETGMSPILVSLEVIDGDGEPEILGSGYDPRKGDAEHRLVMFEIPPDVASSGNP